MQVINIKRWSIYRIHDNSRGTTYKFFVVVVGAAESDLYYLIYIYIYGKNNIILYNTQRVIITPLLPSDINHVAFLIISFVFFSFFGFLHITSYVIYRYVNLVLYYNRSFSPSKSLLLFSRKLRVIYFWF